MLATKPAEYEYETSPKKVEPEYGKKITIEKKSKPAVKKAKKTVSTKKVLPKAKVKKQCKYNYKPIVYIAITFVMLFIISYRNSQINENYNQKEAIRSQVASVQKQNEQLRVNIENSLNLSVVEKEAKEQLGMQKLDNNQKIYVNLNKSDYIDTASEEVEIKTDKPWYEILLDKLTQIIK